MNSHTHTITGHRDLSDSCPDLGIISTGYQFDEELEAAISDFATQTKMDAKIRRALTSLTYEDVYWASKIENPLVRMDYVLLLYGYSFHL